MAEEARFKIWHVVQSVIGSLLVIAVTALSSTLGELNNNVIRHDEQLRELQEFRKAGDRYTKDMGIAETSARSQADAVMTEKIEDMNANQIRMWTAIRELISKHAGHEFKLNQQERRIDKLEGKHGNN